MRQSSLGSDRVLSGCLLGGVTALVWACFAPGHLNIDSLSQIGEVDSGAFTNRHATLLLALWYPLFELGLGPGFVLALQIGVFVCGAYLVLRVAFGRLAAAAIVVAICLWPPVFGMLGWVGRDTWFAALMVASYGLLARAGELDWPARGRWLWLAAIAIWLALASRQNAFVAMLPAAVVLAAMVVARLGERTGRGSSLRRRPRLAALGLGVALTVGMLGSQVVGAVAVGADDVDPEQYLYIYDLAAFSEREGENLFPPDVAADRDMGPIDTGFSVDSMVNLVLFDPPFVLTPLPPVPAASLRQAWLDRVTGDPAGYLALRTELFGRQLALTRSARQVLIPGVIENPYGYAIIFGGLNSAALDYLDPFTEPHVESIFFAPIDGGPLYAVWLYLLVAALAAVALLRPGATRREPAVGALALGALALQTGLYVLAMGTEYRFEFPAVAAAMLAGAVAIRLAIRTRTTAGSHPDRVVRPARSSPPARP